MVGCVSKNLGFLHMLEHVPLLKHTPGVILNLYPSFTSFLQGTLFLVPSQDRGGGGYVKYVKGMVDVNSIDLIINLTVTNLNLDLQ